jgi:hypothetical protein
MIVGDAVAAKSLGVSRPHAVVLFHSGVGSAPHSDFGRGQRRGSVNWSQVSQRDGEISVLSRCLGMRGHGPHFAGQMRLRQ